MMKRLFKIASRVYVCLNTNRFRLLGIKIGKNTCIYRNVFLDNSKGKIIIGDNCNISRGTVILTHLPFKKEEKKPVTTVEDNVIVFVKSIIYPGVTVGRNSRISACSVVVEDVPPNVVVMGNPARVIKILEDKDSKKS